MHDSDSNAFKYLVRKRKCMTLILILTSDEEQYALSRAKPDGLFG